MCGCHSPPTGRITASGSSCPQSTRSVQRKRRPTSKVELDHGVAREARRHRLEIGDFAGRAAAGHSVPPRSVTMWAQGYPISMQTERSCVHRYCLAEKDDEGASDRRVGGSRPDPRPQVARQGRYAGHSRCSCATGFETGSGIYRGIHSRPAAVAGNVSWLRLHRPHRRLARYPRGSRREKCLRFL